MDSDSLYDNNGKDDQLISAKEEADFRRMLQEANLHVGQAQQLATSLNQQLMQMDSANIESIMNSERHIAELISLIDSSIDEATKIEKNLDEYDTILAAVRDSVELIEEKDSLGHIEKNNLCRLVKDLSDFIYLMDMINEGHLNVLRNADLSTPVGINQCYQSICTLNTFLSRKTELSEMSAYQCRMDVINKMIVDFVDKLFSHLTAIFDTMEIMLECQEWGELIMQKHTQRHRTLLMFSNLTSWLKNAQPSVYQKLLQRYQLNAEKLYNTEFKRFFSNLAQRAGNSNLALLSHANFLLESVSNVDGYTELMNISIAEVQTIVECEQKFCIRFFDLHPKQSSFTPNISNITPDTKLREKQLGDQIKAVIAPIFESYNSYMQNYVTLCKTRHSMAVFSLFSALTRKLKVFQDHGTSYFSILHGCTVVSVKRIFDDEMKSMENALMTVKINKKSRVGIIENISKFRNFVRSVDEVFASSERRTDLDKWLQKLADAVLFAINSAAESSNSKYSSAIVRFENLHTFRDVLAELKIECLDPWRKSVNKMYQEYVNVYVQEQMGKPLEKINIFFDQVERHIKNGKNPKEIAYEQQFSRAELKKVIGCYPAREVRKGLESLYKQVEKHLCYRSPLLEVVWRNMQDEFLKDVKRYQQLIAQCYSAPSIDLEFSIEEVLQFFSEIAQQH